MRPDIMSVAILSAKHGLLLSGEIISILLVCLMLIPIAHASASTHVNVGVFVYTWYNPSSPISWQYPKIVDKPVLGFYDSSNPKVVATQIEQIEGLGIDFVMLNWLGKGTFSDEAVGTWYQVAKSRSTQLKLSIMVEPYDEMHAYNYSEIYDRAYALFQADPIHSLITNSKPVIFFYNGATLTGEAARALPLDDRFDVMTVGHRAYVDFWYDDIRGNPDYVPPRIPYRDQVSVLPRFDDYWQWATGLRDHVDVVDRHLTEGLYRSQWDRAIDLASKGLVIWITIATWNEYSERTEIEPHYDNTAYTMDPYYLYNLTKQYVAVLHAQLLPVPEFPEFPTLLMPLIVTLVLVLLIKRRQTL